MAENSHISWTRHSFNGWIGCTKVSPACKFCYAERDWDHRFHRVKWGPSGPRSLTSDDTWNKPLIWNRAAAAAGEVHTVFAFSLADNMDDHPSILPAWRARFCDLIAPTLNLEWLLLTKRPENWERFLPGGLRGVMQNVRLGVSIEDQEWADIRAPYLRMAHNLGWKTFVSYGPACGSVDWDDILPWTDWLVSEGESGPKARPSNPDWFREARDACARHSVPFHHKQNGEWGPEIEYPTADSYRWPDRKNGEEAFSYRVGVEKAGRLLDGVLHNEFPT